MPHISDLYVYPIKSCSGTRLDTARIGRRGIEHDREWMLVDPEGTFLSQRQLPRMALIRPRMLDGIILVEAPEVAPLRLNTHPDGKCRRVKIWRDRCEALDQGREAGQWFSEFLSTECRLVRMTERNVRDVDPDYAVAPGNEVGFADGFPFLLTSKASLEELNARLDEPIEMNRFRPNIVVSGAEAFAEDGWESFAVRNMVFHVVKPCARCSVTTVHQLTARRGKEPLRTLAMYRQKAGKVLFGQNLVHDGRGEISVGDELTGIA